MKKEAIVALFSASFILWSGISQPVLAAKLRSPINDGPWAITNYFDHGGVWDWNGGNKTYAGHKGTDWGISGVWGGWYVAMESGVDVLAATEGTVVYVTPNQGDYYDRCCHPESSAGGYCTLDWGTKCTGTHRGLGNQVEIQHPDGTRTIYGHLKRGSIRVKEYEYVACGQIIGQVGSSGFSWGPHLHLEVQTTDTVPFDPFSKDVSLSSWVEQGVYGGLPSATCPTPPPPPLPPIPSPCDEKKVGFYSDGWHYDGSSGAFCQVYKELGEAKIIGIPDNSPGETPYVHSWGSLLIQDFKDGENVDCAIIGGSNPKLAYLLKMGFWKTYKNLRDDQRTSCLGKPIDDERSSYGAQGKNTLAIQDFEYGHMEFYRDGCSQSSGCVSIYTKKKTLTTPFNDPCFVFNSQASSYAPVCVKPAGKNGLGCRTPLPDIDIIPNSPDSSDDSCGCNGSNPILNCTITGTYSCTGRNSITLTPNFHAVQGSNVTLRP